MPGSSTSSLTDADAYQAELGDLFAAFIVVSPVAFTAHVTRVTLRHLHLLRVQESLSRVAYVSLPPEQALISFSSDPSLSLVWRGLTLQPDEIMFHGRAERLHQRTAGPSCWGGIALSAASLAAFTKIETGRTLALPESGRILRPLPRDRKHLLHVHREAAHPWKPPIVSPLHGRLLPRGSEGWGVPEKPRDNPMHRLQDWRLTR
jgi:hypothetical protein